MNSLISSKLRIIPACPLAFRPHSPGPPSESHTLPSRLSLSPGNIIFSHVSRLTYAHILLLYDLLNFGLLYSPCFHGLSLTVSLSFSPSGIVGLTPARNYWFVESWRPHRGILGYQVYLLTEICQSTNSSDSSSFLLTIRSRMVVMAQPRTLVRVLSGFWGSECVFCVLFQLPDSLLHL